MKPTVYQKCSLLQRAFGQRITKCIILEFYYLVTIYSDVKIIDSVANNSTIVIHRQGIIDGLKKNWEDLHHQYQGLSVVTDTAPKKARKERMEAEMKQLERDIETIEKHRVIYIAN